MVRENVLVTSAGSVIAQGIIKSLNLVYEEEDNPVKYEIIGTDMSPYAPGTHDRVEDYNPEEGDTVSADCETINQ